MELWSILCLIQIFVGIILSFLGTAAVIKIYKGSKIAFAYTMTAFICAYGVKFIATGVLGYSNKEWS